MSFRVSFEPAAQKDLEEIHEWIADRASLQTARRYTQRLRTYCKSFALFPQRGQRRDDIRPGLRFIGFERRVTIAFVVLDDRVKIVRVLYGGRDIGLLATDQEP